MPYKKNDLSYSKDSAQNTREDTAHKQGRTPPSSIESEQSVLGAVLIDNESIYSIMELLLPEHFYNPAHTLIYESMLRLSEKREPLDIITLSNDLKVNKTLDISGGVEYLSYLIDIVPAAANTPYYAKIIRDMALRRRVIHEASEIINDSFNCEGDVNNFIDAVEQRIFRVSESRTGSRFSHVSDLVKDSIKHIEDLYINKKGLTGLSSGFIDLDEMTDGFQPSDLIILAGRPSMGKTAFALNIGYNAAMMDSTRIAVFSLEMSKEQVVTRMLSSESKVSSSRVRSGNLLEDDFPKLVEAASKVAHAEIFIDDTPAISVVELRAKARRLHREKKLGLIVIDYLQLVRGSTKSVDKRELEISEISRSLKALAKELNIPVIALSQLNRGVESRQDKRPLMSDLRESGAIEQDADIIAFIYRDEVYNIDTPDKGVAEIIIAKHRNGPVGTVKLAFLGEYTSFSNLADNADYDYEE